MPGPMGGREARWAVPKGVRQNAGISGRSGGRGKEDEIGGGVFMWREVHDGDEGVVHKTGRMKAHYPPSTRLGRTCS